MTATATYSVEAYNTARESENKIHDDAVAQKFGFRGGLVPGVDVYAYMTQPLVGRWGLDWLTHGTATCRFLKPVYDGNEAVVTATLRSDDSDVFNLQVDSAGTLCATGWASLAADHLPRPALTEIAAQPLPADRPDASADTLAAGLVLGTYEVDLTAEVNTAYRADVRDQTPIYAEQRLAHPGFVLRMANWALTQNVVLGPWIHVGSTVQNYALIHEGQRVSGRAKVTDNYEKKGHRFVDLDVIVAADGAVASLIRHTAIYQPRGLGD